VAEQPGQGWPGLPAACGEALRLHQCHAVGYSAVLCRAVLCRAVLCRAVSGGLGTRLSVSEDGFVSIFARDQDSFDAVKSMVSAPLLALLCESPAISTLLPCSTVGTLYHSFFFFLHTQTALFQPPCNTLLATLFHTDLLPPIPWRPLYLWLRISSVVGPWCAVWERLAALC